jgi:glycosyltransferase involved in cell wall biosynthesis
VEATLSNDELPLVSIVMPAYNYAHYLGEAVNSVLAQDYPNVELIVLDDGSADGTREVLEGYGGRFYWETHENMGEARTLAKGWGMSRGEILGKLSADDVLLPNAVSACVGALQAEPGAVMAYGLYDMLSADSSTVYRLDVLDLGYRGMVAKLKNPVGPGAFFRRWAYEAAGPWDGSLPLTLDLDFWMRLGLHGRLARVPEVLALFRAHEGSQSFGQADEAKSEEFVRLVRSFYERQRVPADVLALERESLSNAYILSASSHLRSGGYGKGLARLLEALRLYPKNPVRTVRVATGGMRYILKHRLYEYGMRIKGRGLRQRL